MSERDALLAMPLEEGRNEADEDSGDAGAECSCGAASDLGSPCPEKMRSLYSPNTL
jgi:hypothetical protein